MTGTVACANAAYDKPEENSKFSEQSVLLSSQLLLLVLVELPHFRQRNDREIFLGWFASCCLDFHDRRFYCHLKNRFEKL
jgi:hypothetical protein